MKIAFQANSVPIQFVEPEIYYRNKIHAFFILAHLFKSRRQWQASPYWHNQ